MSNNAPDLKNCLWLCDVANLFRARRIPKVWKEPNNDADQHCCVCIIIKSITINY